MTKLLSRNSAIQNHSSLRWYPTKTCWAIDLHSTVPKSQKIVIKSRKININQSMKIKIQNKVLLCNSRLSQSLRLNLKQ